MSDTGCTWPECLDVPEHVFARLQATADDEFERACDTGGEWDEEKRARVLNAAHTVEALESLGLSALPPAQVAALAERAIRLPFEDGVLAPDRMEDISNVVALTGMSRELIKLRDAATAREQEFNRPRRRRDRSRRRSGRPGVQRGLACGENDAGVGDARVLTAVRPAARGRSRLPPAHDAARA